MELLFLLGFAALFGAGGVVTAGLGGDADDESVESDTGDAPIDVDAPQLLAGTEADDDLQGGAGEDTLDGAEGADTLAGGDGADILLGRFGNDVLLGGPDGDLLKGGAGDDTLSGLDTDPDEASDDDAPDTLVGGDGEDRLVVGSGDEATGGADADSFETGGWINPDDPPEFTDFDAAEDRLVVVVPENAPGAVVLQEDPEVAGTALVLLDGQIVARLPGQFGVISLGDIEVVETLLASA